MATKTAAISSIFIILFGQTANIGVTLLSGLPDGISMLTLALMIAGGISGGIFGRAFNKKINEKAVDRMIIGLCVINAVKYLL